MRIKMSAKYFPMILASLITVTPCFSQESKPSVESLGWIAGCWELNAQGMTTAEQWMKPGGKSMIGMSRTIKGDRTVMFEFLRIAEKEDGLYYIARPSSAQAETPFKLIKLAKGEAVFENLTHDFPQRIIYVLEKPDLLKARIESADKKKGMDIPMARAQCN